MFLGGICVKRKKRWLRWIAWTLLLVLCMNSAGTTVLAVSVEEENIPNINSTQEGEMRTEDFIPEESTSLSEETSKEENTSPSEETPGDSGGRNYSIPGRAFRRRKSLRGADCTRGITETSGDFRRI